MKTAIEPIFFINSTHGQYIPSIAADLIKAMDNVFLPSNIDLDCLMDVENEFYWDEWMMLLDNAELMIDGQKYLLHQSEHGDVWWIHEDDQESFNEL
jgi:hypothetical protein